MRLVYYFLKAFFFIVLTAARSFGLDAAEILRQVDEIRNPQEDYSIGVKVKSLKPGKSPTESALQVFVKGRDNALVQTLSPATDRGRVLLMKQTAMWVYLPTIAKPLRIPLRERLLGEVSNADIARANFTGDYDGVLETTEQTATGEFYVLKLSARNQEVPYAAVKLWAETKSFRPFQAEFYGLSGKLLKTCLYREYKEFGGKIRPTRLVMNDPLIKEQYTVIDYHNLKIEPIPEKYFTDDYLKKLSR